MAKNNGANAFPTLRFPIFRHKPAWKTDRMDVLYSFIRNNALSRDKLNYEGGKAKNVHYGDIHSKFSTLFDITKERVPYINRTEKLPDAGSDDYCIEGDIIFADASEDIDDVGKCIEIVRLDGQLLLAGQHTILARQRRNALIVGFGGHLFQSTQIRSQIQKEAQGTKVYAISPIRLASMEIIYPGEKKEQRKIADCLTSLHEVIAVQVRRLETLRTYKRGLVQRLFPCAGETFPDLRFPSFGKTSSWHLQKLSSLVSKTANAADIEPGATYRELGIRSHGKGIFHKQPISGKAIGEKRVFHVVQDALILSIVFAWEQAVATTSRREVGMIASHRFPMYVANQGKCDVRYVKEYFLTKMGKHLLEVASPGGAGRNKTLGQKEFENLEIALPESVEEQAQIANCLESLEARIAAESKKLNMMMEHKRGLIQQLLPSQVGS